MNIIVTGASKGIGAEVVKVLSKFKGNHIVAVSRNGEGLRKLLNECVKITPSAKILTCEFDLSQFDFYPFLLQKIETFFLNPDILINNAGKLVNKPIEKTDHQEFDEIFNVNVKSIYFLTQMFAPIMNKGGHIVNIGSLGGMQGTKKFSGLAAYSASKGAVSILTEALAEELAEREISVNCLALGGVQTEMFAHAFPGNHALQTPLQAASFIADFAVTGQRYFNGKILPLSISVP
ncbi:MAG: SDR family oxidoreductase [Bacteroidetes bacterium]|nr:SDR family oxidoreductase [Bacteroidota bacterium]